jgi:hypothetical protein
MAATWQAAANLMTAPLAAARLNDLCFEAGLGDRGSRARRAIETYLTAPQDLASSSSVESDNRRRYAHCGSPSRPNRFQLKDLTLLCHGAFAPFGGCGEESGTSGSSAEL